MSDRREAAARSPGAANSGTPPGPAADRERVILLECRLEQMRSALSAAREEADSARTRLAESCAREADHARRFGEIHAELAEARAEVAALHRRLERSEALKSEIEGYLFEAGARGDTDELARLRKRVLVDDQRALVNDRTLARLRWRVEDLAATRETLLTRVAEWQQLIRNEGPDAADLSEFLAELRREILELEHRNVTSDARELILRQRLAMAGIDPDGEPEPLEPPVGETDAAPVLTEDVVGAEDAGPGSESESKVVGPADAAPVADADETAPALEAVGTDVLEEPVAVAQTAEEEPPATAAETNGEEEPATAAETNEEEEPADPAQPAESEPTIESGAAAGQDPGADVGAPHEPEPAVASGAPAQPRSRTDALIADLMAAESAPRRADLLLQLGRSGDERAHGMIRPWTESLEPSVRAAAYEALGRLLERAPERLEPYLRTGLADPDARVRRRVALAAATARGLTPRRLLEPLKEDPDPQVRRVVREVLRQSRREGPDPHARAAVAPPAPDQDPPAAPSGHEANGNATSASNRSLRAR
jgi:hypothetical protein